MTARRLPRLVRGGSIAGSRLTLNRLIDEVNARGVSSGGVPGGNYTPLILQLEIRILNTGPPATLTCALPGQQLNPSAQQYTVALPLTFTETSRDGVSYVYTDINNRTADATEVQKMTPIYLVQDLILVMQLGHTGVMYDLNVDGRQWARVP